MSPVILIDIIRNLLKFFIAHIYILYHTNTHLWCVINTQTKILFHMLCCQVL